MIARRSASFQDAFSLRWPFPGLENPGFVLWPFQGRLKPCLKPCRPLFLIDARGRPRTRASVQAALAVVVRHTGGLKIRGPKKSLPLPIYA